MPPLFRIFQRTRLEQTGVLDDETLARRLSGERQVLCIVNSRRHARELFLLLEESEANLHLSARMTPHHRSRTVRIMRERLAAGGWIDPAVELPPDDDMVLAIVSGRPASNITLEDAYELASYGSGGWIVEQYELWETPVVSWWRPLPNPPEKRER